jgi:pyroglutamyl-peptidase
MEIKMKKLLITGFEPFGGEITNPSWDAVVRLPDEINGYKLTRLEIPVVFGEAADTVIKAAEELYPDVILCIGQAGGRMAVTPELVGINLRHASIPDNKGNQPKDEPAIVGDREAYFSNLPARRMAEAIAAAGIPSQLSYSAGAYVCNDVLYTLLARYHESPVRVGFIHVPYSDDQNKQPSMSIESIVKAIAVAIETMGSEA